MKKVKLTGKLSLNKETISKLNDDQMKNVIGGVTYTDRTCNTLPCNQTVGCPIQPHTISESACFSNALCASISCFTTAC